MGDDLVAVLRPVRPAHAVPVPTTAVGIAVVGGSGLLKGWAFKETTNVATATFNLRDGDVNGPMLAPFTLATNESTRDWLSGDGLAFEAGLFVDVVAGSVAGSLWIVFAQRIGAGLYVNEPASLG